MADENMQILFERNNLEKDKLEGVWHEGSDFYCKYDGKIILLNHYPDDEEAGLGLKCLLYKLGRISQWI